MMNKHKSKAIRVLVVVVNYFSHPLINNLLKGLAHQGRSHNVKFEVVCADNSSSNKEHEALLKIQDKSALHFEILQQTNNVGFGRAINHATQGRQFDFLWLLNPDIDLLENTLDELIKPIIDLENGLIGGLTITENFEPDYRHAWQDPSLLNTTGWAIGIKKISSNPLWHDSYRHNSLSKDRPYKVDNISGCCMLISHKLWRETQGFDEDYFLYSEEIDLCQRARSLGYQPYVAPKARLRHSNHSSDVGLSRLPLIYSSKLIYADKHRGTCFQLSYRTIIVAGAFLRSVAGLLQGNIGHARAWREVALNTFLAKKIHHKESHQ